jgi:hypothetical protein
MKDFFKGKFITILVVAATVILAGVAIFTAVRLYQLRNQSVSPATPERPSASTVTSIACTTLTFNLTEPSLTPSTTPTTGPTSGVSPTPTTNVVSPTPTLPPPPSRPEPPQCTAQRPTAPILTSVKKGGTQAVLTWTSVNLATHYVIAYGTTPANLEFGVPNTGKVTTYTVKNLGANTKYYFTVYAVNDCMPSEGSTIVGSVAGSATGTEQLPTAGVSLPTFTGIGVGILLIALAVILAL